MESKKPDGPQGPESKRSLRGEPEPRGGVGGIVKLDVQHSRFWILGVLAFIFFYHSYGILSGIFGELTIVPYDDAIILGVLEALTIPVLAGIFLWKSMVWWHDRPWSAKHVFDDQNLLD